MDFINSLFNGSNREADTVSSQPKSAINPPPVFFMERNDVPSSFEMNEMEDGNAPYRAENKDYKKPTKAQRHRAGVRFGETNRKFFDNTEPVTSISQRGKVRVASPPKQEIVHDLSKLSRSRSLSDSLSDLSDINAGTSSNRFRSISQQQQQQQQPVTQPSRRSPSPVGSPTTITEYNAQIKKDDHEKELALALMRRPSSPVTGWHGGKRRTKSGCSTNKTKRIAKRNRKRPSKSGCCTNSAKRQTKRQTRRQTRRQTKRQTKRPAKPGCSTSTRRVKR